MFNPNPPGVVRPYGPGNASSEIARPGDPRGVSGGQYASVPSALAPLLSSRGVSDEEIQYWYQMLQQNADALKEASGWDRIKLQAEREDAQKALDNALRLRQMDVESAKYGVDQRRQGERETLEENRRQFNANHGLALNDQALRAGDTYAKWASTPDTLFQIADVHEAANAARSGGYQTPLGAGGKPQTKTWRDFAALTGYGQGGPGAAQGGGGGKQQDVRLKAMRAVGEAMPPSATPGYDQQDWKAIDAITALYFSGRPGEVEQLDPVQQREAQSAIRRRGWNAEQVVAQRNRSLPGQGSSRAA